MRFRSLAALGALTIFAAGAAGAQQRPDTAAQRRMREGQDMRMMRDSSDARLERLVATMNAAKGDKKVQAMADVINALMDERRQMREHMRRMIEGGMSPGASPHGMMPQSGSPHGAMPPAARRPGDSTAR